MSDITIKEGILAIITISRDLVGGGGAPIFYAADQDEQSKISLYLAKILNGMVHDLGNGVYVIIKH